MDKKLLDLTGLQRYDTKLKESIDSSVTEATELTPIDNSEITALFNTETPEPETNN